MTTDNGTLVTIIVPVFNIQEFLPACLDSVVAQSHKNLQIIVVDDGSTDGSGRIADDYAARDHRVTVIHQDNGGLGNARNTALNAAQGEFIAMIDGDDLIHRQFVERLLQAIGRNDDTRIAIAQWTKFRRKTDEILQQATAPIAAGDPQLFPRDEALNLMLYQHTLTHSVCSRLFHASIFKTLRFPEGRLYEDIAIIFPIMEQCPQVTFVDVPLYFYRQQRSGSITTEVKPERFHIITALESMEQRIKAENRAFLPAVHSRQLSAAFNMLMILPDHCRQELQQAWQLVKRLRRECFFNPRVRLKNKAAILLSLLGYRVTRAVAHR